MDTPVKIRTSIRPELMRKRLLRGSLIGACGAAIIVAGGTFLNLALLRTWGIPVFFTGILLIAFGLVPYRRLASLVTTPHELTYDGTRCTFFKLGRPLLSFQASDISSLAFHEDKTDYGLSLHLKRPLRITLLQPKPTCARFLAENTHPHSDLFLPYFSKRAVESLEEALA